MSYEYITGKESLLDLGIGTGLSSVLFAKAGLDVIGLDGSTAMLKECAKKGFAKQLHQYDIRNVPFPFANAAFSFVICCGVFHFFDTLGPTIEESYRLLNDSGIMGFTIASLQDSELRGETNKIPDYIQVPTMWGIPIYQHSDDYIWETAGTVGFSITKEQKILIDSGDKTKADLVFKAIIMQKDQS